MTVNFVQEGKVRHLVLVGDVWSANANIRLDDGTPVAYIDRHVSSSGSATTGSAAAIPGTVTHATAGAIATGAATRSVTTSICSNDRCCIASRDFCYCYKDWRRYWGKRFYYGPCG
jgi:hypothetical protein